MKPFFSSVLIRTLTAAALVSAAAGSASLAGEIAPQNEQAGGPTAELHQRAGAEVECIMPDGHVSEVARAAALGHGTTALLLGDTLSCALQEGQTTFVIKVPQSTTLDRLTFLNENVAAAGALKISVSNEQLPASSRKWVEVDGQIAFANKRLFDLSLLGVEARFVKLTFTVDKGPRLASADL